MRPVHYMSVLNSILRRCTEAFFAGSSVEATEFILAHAQATRPSSFGLAVRNGHIKRITDSDIQSSVLEVAGVNVSTTYISCPADPKKTLGVKLPFLVMIIKNLKKYFTFEVTVLDDKNVHRRFRASNYQVRPRCRRTSSCLHARISWSARVRAGGPPCTRLAALIAGHCSPRRASSPSSARCRCGWTRAGTRSSST